jgi:hypothetical protein
MIVIDLIDNKNGFLEIDDNDRERLISSLRDSLEDCYT